MKLNPYLTHSYLIPAFALMSLPLAHAQISFDDGRPATATGASATNWDTDTAPDHRRHITIGSGYTVTYDAKRNLPSYCNTDRRRTLIPERSVRANGAISLSLQLGLTCTQVRFYDLNNATLNFQDGAQFTPATGSTREPTYL